MSAQITAPWYDPLSLIDGFSRIVLASDVPDLAMLAKVPGENRLPLRKGCARQLWDRCFEVAYNEPIVTYVPNVTAIGDQPGVANNFRLNWRPLLFSELPGWLNRLREHGYEPTALGSLLTLHSTCSRMTSAQRIDREHLLEQFQALMMLLRHPLSCPLDTPEQMRVALHPHNLTTMFVAETHSAFQPFVFGTERLSHSNPGNARASWRRVQHHGYSRSGRPTFYGKQWAASAPNNVLYAGVELEMELGSQRVNNLMQRTLFTICDEFGNGGAPNERLHIEGDGSLPQFGLEVVLMPHEVHSAHAEAFWRRIYLAACRTGASNSTARAGMHIHVSAAPALRALTNVADSFPLRGENFSQTTAFFIDLCTGMLAGGPSLWLAQPYPSNEVGHDLPAVPAQTRALLNEIFQVEDGSQPEPVNMPRTVSQPLYPTSSIISGRRAETREPRRYQPNDVRFATHAFGRPRSWDGHFADITFMLMRPLPHTQLERYRHVNWNNEKTIEFRLFGPRDFDPRVDWINIATQMASAIVHFSRSTALNVLRTGTQRQARPAIEFYNSLPNWLQPMLLIAGTDTSYGAAEHYQSAMRCGATQLPAIGNGAFAIQRSDSDHPWRVGLPHASYNDVGAAYLFHECRTQLSSSNSRMRTRRGAEVYLACIGLWREFTKFLQRNAPQYDILLRYLEQAVLPHLPTAEQEQAVRMEQPVPAPEPVVSSRPATPEEAERARRAWMMERDAIEDPAEPVPVMTAQQISDALRSAPQGTPIPPGVAAAAASVDYFNRTVDQIIRTRHSRRSQAQIRADNAAGLTLRQARARDERLAREREAARRENAAETENRRRAGLPPT